MLALCFPVFFFLIAATLLVMAARNDWRALHIRNSFSLGLIGLFVTGVIIPNTLFAGVALIDGVIAGGVVFLITMMLFVLRAMGGGDTKLASATALLVGTTHLGLFLATMALAGGVLAAFALLVRRQPSFLPDNPPAGSWLAALKLGMNKVPYGLAIATGGLVALTVKWLVPSFF